MIIHGSNKQTHNDVIDDSMTAGARAMHVTLAVDHSPPPGSDKFSVEISRGERRTTAVAASATAYRGRRARRAAAAAVVVFIEPACDV